MDNEQFDDIIEKKRKEKTQSALERGDILIFSPPTHWCAGINSMQSFSSERAFLYVKKKVQHEDDRAKNDNRDSNTEELME